LVASGCSGRPRFGAIGWKGGKGKTKKRGLRVMFLLGGRGGK